MTPQYPQQSDRVPSSLPVVALVLSIIGICMPPLLVIGLILGIVALVQRKGSPIPSIISLVLVIPALPIWIIMLAIAIPNFVKFQARSKQTECKVNLKAAYSALKSYHDENQVFTMHPEVVGFSPERGNRYLYAFSATGAIDANTGAPAPHVVGIGADTKRFPEISNEKLRAAIPEELRQTLGIKGSCPQCEMTIACAGNIDNDQAIDVWSISSVDRPGAPAGTLQNDVSDIDNY